MLKTKELARTDVMLDRETLKLIDEFAKTMAEDRSTVIRHLIKRALLEERLSLAVRKFQEGAPFRKAAEMAGLDYWDFQAELDKRGIPVSVSLPFARRRIKH
jgi:Uncharacterised protein family (UPF0175).